MSTKSTSNVQPFHLAIPVDDLEAAREFYGELLGCPEGRSADQWADFDLYGHQLVVHFAEGAGQARVHANPVDGHNVPIPHFGVVLQWQAWEQLANKLRAHGMDFVIEPYVRFEGQVGEQATMFFQDPSGNALEFKAFRNPAQLFRS